MVDDWKKAMKEYGRCLEERLWKKNMEEGEGEKMGGLGKEGEREKVKEGKKHQKEKEMVDDWKEDDGRKKRR